MNKRGIRFNRSFEWRLLAILLVALAPFFIRDVYRDVEARQRTLESAGAGAQELAGAVAWQHQDLVESARRDLYLLSLQEQIHGDQKACAEVLAKVVHGTGFFRNLVRVDLAGRLTCSADPGVSALPEEDKSALDRVLEKATFACGNGALAGKERLALLPLGAPLFDERGRLTGALVGEIGLDWFSQGLADRSVPTGATVALTDENGLILSVWPAEPDYRGRRWEGTDQVRDLKAPGEAVSVGLFLDGTVRIVAEAAYENGLRTVVAVDREAVLGSANRRFYTSLAISGLVLLVVLALVRLAAHRLWPGLVEQTAGDQGPPLTGGEDLPGSGPEVGLVDPGEDWHQGLVPDEPLAGPPAGPTDEFWRRVIDSLPVGVYAKEVKSGYRYTVWNARMEELFANRREEVLGRDDYDLLPNRKEAEYNRQVEEAIMRSGRPADQGAEKVTTKVGSLVVHSTRVPLYDRDGRPDTLLGLVREPAAVSPGTGEDSRTVALHRLATRNLPNGALLMFDHHLQVTLAGGTGLADMGLSHEPVDGKNIRQLFVPRISGVLEGLCREALEGRPAAEDLAFGEKTSLARAWPLQDESGRVYAGLLLTQDITDLKIREGAMTRAKESAEEANRAKSRFLAGIAQDIGAPMNTVVNMTELALQANPSPRQREYLDQARESAGRLLTLVSDLQDLAMIEAGTLRLETVDFDLHDLMATALRGLEGAAASKGLAMDLHLAEDLPRYLWGDPARLSQIVVNLVGNAIKYTKRGGVEVMVRRLTEPDEGEIRSPAPSGSQVLLFTVKDTGRGIPVEKLAGIFNGFRQVEGSSARQYGGTGLGLAICGQLTEMMGGRMWVESKVGRGSIFYFTAIIKPGNPKQVPARQMSLAFDGDWLSPVSAGDREAASDGAEGPGIAAGDKAGESSGADPDWADLAAMFLEDYPHKVKRLRDAAVIEDWSRAGELARSLCGDAGRAGAGRVAELATALEQAARDGQGREVKRLLAEMEREMAVFQKAGPEES